MKIVELAEKVSKEIGDNSGFTLLSAVVYGPDINRSEELAKDCHLVLVVDRIEMDVLEKINDIIIKGKGNIFKEPLIVQLDEIEGMMDSVPANFLDFLSSYQTVYGKSIFKGLSSLNHEHLRAQTEMKLRENLFLARKSLFIGMQGGTNLSEQLENIKAMLNRSVHFYCILNKPWLTEEKERFESFCEDFKIEDEWLRRSIEKDPNVLSDDEKKRLSFMMIENGIKPILRKVDDMGPGKECT